VYFDKMETKEYYEKIRRDLYNVWTKQLSQDIADCEKRLQNLKSNKANLERIRKDLDKYSITQIEEIKCGFSVPLII
jgi:vacuolar-type H+-ATPase catalytic subunit A/Vma1